MCGACHCASKTGPEAKDQEWINKISSWMTVNVCVILNQSSSEGALSINAVNAKKMQRGFFPFIKQIINWEANDW
jgi:hypothetical protein